MNCKQARELILRNLDEPMEAEGKNQLENHLAGCSKCRDYLAENRILLDNLILEDPPDISSDFDTKMFALIDEQAHQKFTQLLFKFSLTAVTAAAIFTIGLYIGKAGGLVPDETTQFKELVGKHVACQSVFQPEKMIQPALFYTRVPEDSVIKVKQDQNWLILPRYLMSHGPYELDLSDGSNVDTDVCLTLASAWGDVLSLQIIPNVTEMTGLRKKSDFRLQVENDSILLSRIAWIQGKSGFVLEGRVPAAHLVDLAMELDEKITR